MATFGSATAEEVTVKLSRHDIGGGPAQNLKKSNTQVVVRVPSAAGYLPTNDLSTAAFLSLSHPESAGLIFHYYNEPCRIQLLLGAHSKQ